MVSILLISLILNLLVFYAKARPLEDISSDLSPDYYITEGYDGVKEKREIELVPVTFGIFNIHTTPAPRITFEW
uniref:6 kDa salivary protein n=1 Tax=Lutzomyia longipalpis TaxID=7200 RepID=Q5WPT0_LUTLO|nr:6 kDa salivary protein [Lutzomyia longipalpis]